jgi:S1-C subfamily serine protease
VFARVFPSVAFIETPAFTGSGVLIEGGYVVTNAHVVWPFGKVRVVFPDGREFLDAPVLGSGLLDDLAVIGPLDTAIEPVELVDGEGLITGRDVFLIGYPGEPEEFPQPTITRGLISRQRQWDAISMTYFQTDATIAGGQSGRALVSENAEVIGISGLTFTEGGFGLAASASDVKVQIQGLIERGGHGRFGRPRNPLGRVPRGAWHDG